MSAITDLASSRPLGVAAILGSGESNRHEAITKRVVLTADAVALSTANGRWCFLDCVRLLARSVGPLEIALPPDAGDFRYEVEQLATKVWTRGTVIVTNASDEGYFLSAVAILNVGNSIDVSLPWTSINSNGWVARISSGPTRLPGDMGQSNPISALMAASMGVAEVFKRIYGISSDVAPLLDATQFSLYDLRSPATDLGPPLPTVIELGDTVVSGAGAIGNGIALLMSQLPIQGRVHLVDKQNFAPENFGTCLLLDNASWIGQGKAPSLAAWLQREGLKCSGERSVMATAVSGTVVESMNVDLVLNGLDDVSARHDAQALWPAVLVDGGINAIGAAVTTHRLDKPEGACMLCCFPLPTGADARVLQQKATGLAAISLAGNMERPLTEQDIEMADSQMRLWLRQQKAIGKSVCATVSEAQLRDLGLAANVGFNPSVPFVATASAALVLAQAVKTLLDPDHPFVQQFQIGSLFVGPSSSLSVMNQSDSRCRCVVHHDVISKVASSRRGRTIRNAQV